MSRFYPLADEARVNAEAMMFMRQILQRYPKVPMYFAQEIGQRHAIEIILLQDKIRVMEEKIKNIL